MKQLAAGLILLSMSMIPGLCADLNLAGIFTDHMVLQRDIEVPIWGWTGPQMKVEVAFAGQVRSAMSDARGKWMVRLQPIKAGGPFRMVVESVGEKLILEDILIGDVWICSGQSNMWRPVTDVHDAEKEIEDAKYPGIRLFSFPRTLAAEPADDILPPHPDEQRISSLRWEVCSPASIPDFSAVGYFFGREVHLNTGIPIGLIKDCWGSTKVEPWMSLEALEESPYYPDIKHELVDPVRVLDSVNLAFASRIDDSEKRDRGLRCESPEGAWIDPGTCKAIWAEPEWDDSQWETLKLPNTLEAGGVGNIEGIVWFRRKVFIPEELINEDFLLSLDRVNDVCQVWINGRFIGEEKGRIPGSPYYGSQPVSKFSISPGIMTAGRNVITVRVKNYTGGGGIAGDYSNLYLESGSFRISLSGNWKYRIGMVTEIPPPKRVRPHQYPTVLYNGMIHPLIPMAIKGVIWYQGESNTGNPIPYRDLFPRMIWDWRSRWGQGDFPFLFVQLANFGVPDSLPGDDNWALLREAQTMALKEPNTGMAVTIDIGEADNIHPANKQDVGYRLALAARHIAYGEDLVYSGPVFRSMTVDGSTVRLEFDHVGAGLQLDDRYGYARGFAISGEDRDWHWAKGRLEGNIVVLHTAEVERPVAVRYAWSQNPEDANLYNEEGLPAVPFRTDNWDQ